MATPTTCPQRLVRLPPSSNTTAPASGNASSSHAARCTPAAAMVAGAAAACAATADAAAASEPVTALPPVLARGETPRSPPVGPRPGSRHGQYFSRFGSSTDADWRARKIDIRIARPTTTSAAATTITKNAMTCPSSDPCILAKATNARLTAFSMSSTHMNTTIALRRTSTPTAPITKRITASATKCPGLMIVDPPAPCWTVPCWMAPAGWPALVRRMALPAAGSCAGHPGQAQCHPGPAQRAGRR